MTKTSCVVTSDDAFIPRVCVSVSPAPLRKHNSRLCAFDAAHSLENAANWTGKWPSGFWSLSLSLLYTLHTSHHYISASVSAPFVSSWFSVITCESFLRAEFLTWFVPTRLSIGSIISDYCETLDYVRANYVVVYLHSLAYQTSWFIFCSCNLSLEPQFSLKWHVLCVL